MTAQRTHVVVIGGGYAGTLAANHLRLRADVDITLVNPRPKFVERIRLHQFVAGSGDATVDYGTLLGEGVRLVVDSADAHRHRRARSPARLGPARCDYDYVIYAVGSTGAAPGGGPGCRRIRLSDSRIRATRSGCATRWTSCTPTLRSPSSAPG